MPWQECSKMDEKVRFIARLLDGEKMAPLCREFNISRKTGYQIRDKYLRLGQEGSVPETWVTLYSGDIGNTFILNGSSTGSTRFATLSKYPKS